jgi:hypothetical protein
VFAYLVSFTLKLEKPTLFKWAVIAVVMLGVVLFTGINAIGTSDVRQGHQYLRPDPGPEIR